MAAATSRQLPEPVPGELRIVIREHGTTSTIELKGEWDLANRQASLAAVNEGLARRPECVLLDLSRVSFIDSSGIHAMIETSKRCAELETRLVVVPGPRPVQRLFDLSGLTERLTFIPDRRRSGKREIPQR
jgi:anti-sigma B factor antagonist